VKYLTPQQILALHDQAIKRFGGSNGLRDKGLLESAAARPQASFGGEDLYPIIFDKAAALMHLLLKNHPFVDGNKRTALSSCGIFLMQNGYRLINKHEEELKFALNVEKDSLDLKGIAAWLKKNSKKL
jgi:death on curing protein